MDEYFFVLMDGKDTFDLLTSEYRKMYYNGEWWGWVTLLEDWKGREWILKYLVSWHKGNLDEIFKGL